MKPQIPMAFSYNKTFNVDPEKGITDHLKDAHDDLMMLERIMNYCAEVDINPYAENPDKNGSSSTMFIEFLPDTNLTNVSWYETDMSTEGYTSPSWLMANIQEAVMSIMALCHGNKPQTPKQ